MEPIVLQKSLWKVIVSIMIISLFAQLTIDVGDIPITGQTFAIISCAFFLSPKESFFALFLYLVLGFLGVPIFSNGASGIDKLFGGSGGFLVGFLVSAYFVSKAKSYFQKLNLISIFTITTLATLFVLFFGVGRLAQIYDLEKALEYGFYPFWKGAIVKVIIGTIHVYLLKRKFSEMTVVKS